MFGNDTVLAVDYETTGVATHSDSVRAVGVGIANSTDSAYVDLQTISDSCRSSLYAFLNDKKLVFHNVTFDAAIYWKECGQMPNTEMCTSAAFRYLATEGWLAQSYSLKTAMIDILGWEEPNTEELYSWLKEHKLSKGEMWQAPADILGKYCAMDAVATFHLYEYFSTVVKDFPSLAEYMKEQFIPLSRLVVAQQFNGIHINVIKLRAYYESLHAKLDEALRSFLSHPDIRPHIDEYNGAIVDKLRANMPVQLTKQGKVSKLWERRVDKIAEAEQTNHFKITSKDQLIWLFYNKMGFKPTRFTEKGKPQVDKNVLPTLGEHGKAINDYNKVLKEMQYVRACLNMCDDNDVLHPQLKTPGTNTGRLSGGIQE